MSALKVGDKVPEFELKSQNEENISFEDLRGKKVLISFYPLAFTPVWTNQISFLEENYEKLQNLGIVPMGISIDSIYSNGAWAKTMGVKSIPLLSDFWPHGAVASKFGVFREKDGFSERANFLVDEHGTIVFSKVYALEEQPDFHEIIDNLK